MIHAFQSAVVDDPSVPTDVRPQSNWNDTHPFRVSQLSVPITLVAAGAAAHDLVELTTGAINQAVTLPTAVGNLGRAFTILKKDSAAGSVVIGTTGGQVIKTAYGNLSSYPLVQQGMFLGVYSDGANWQVFSKSYKQSVGEVPTGTVNGSNVTFTLAFAPFPISTVRGYRNGARLVSGAFSVSGATITFVSAPQVVGGVPDAIWFDYEY